MGHGNTNSNGTNKWYIQYVGYLIIINIIAT